MYGLETEIKWTRISQGAKGTPFYSFAVATIEAIYIGDSKGTYKNLEIHLDMGEKPGEALIEFVTRGTDGAVGLTRTEFATTLKVLRQMKEDHFGKNTEEFKSFLQSNFVLNEGNPLIEKMSADEKKDLDNHFYTNFEVFSQQYRGKYPAVQITTSLTAKEMVGFMKAGVHPSYTGAGGPSPSLEALEKNGDLEIMRYLDSIPKYPDCEIGRGKGTGSLMKHAYEQFLISNSELLADTSVSMDKKTSCTHHLKTNANKLAPVVYRRPGEPAYVIEFRGTGQWEGSVVAFINDGSGEPTSATICPGCDNYGQAQVGPGKCNGCGLDLATQDCKAIFHLKNTDSKLMVKKTPTPPHGQNKYCCMVTTFSGNTKFTKTKCGA